MFRIIVAGIVSAMLFSGEAVAQCASFPTTLQNGSTADATQVMGDFTYLAGCLSNSPNFFGNVSIANTGVSVPNEYAFLNFQALASPTPGIPNMIRLWDNAQGTVPYGFGISASLLNIISHTNTAFFNGAVGNEVMRITNTGLVGIGTSTPDGTLTVKAGNGDMVLNGTYANGLSMAGSIAFEDNGTSIWHLFAWHSDGDFYLQSAAGSPPTNMRVVPGANSWSATSDVRLKTNIKTLPVLERLGGYRAVSFDWKGSGKHDIGVVAQELYKVFPEVVDKGSEGALSGPMDKGTWSVQYDRLGALALEAAKELKAENENLSAERESDRKTVAALIEAVHQQSAEIAKLRDQLASMRQSRTLASNSR